MRGGTITPRPLADGSPAWVLMWRVGGRRVKRTVRGTRREAEAALTAALAARDKGGQRAIDTDTFATHAAVWLESKRSRVEPATLIVYRQHLERRLVPAFGNLKLRQITRARVEAYLAQLDTAGEISHKTANESLGPLRQILARAVREGVIANNPAVSVDRDAPLDLPYDPPPIKPLTAPQARAYLEAAPLWYRPMAEVLLGAGLRIGEAIALEWRDVDRDTSTLRIERAYKRGLIGTPKGDRARAVAIDSHVLGVLREHRQAQLAAGARSTLVFASGAGTHRRPANVRERGHAQTLADAGLPSSVRLHDLRHTAATLWLAAGASVYFVQQQLGHADLQTTIGTYGHPDQAAHREAAERAAAWWRSG
jgi:integrase